MQSLKKVQSGHYENDTYRVFKTVTREQADKQYTNSSRADSRLVTDWVVVNKVTGISAAGAGTKKTAVKLIEDGRI